MADSRREPEPTIHRSEEVVDVDQLGLQLDDEQRSGLSVPAQQIDRAALAVDGIRDFGRDFPPVKRREVGSDLFVKTSMSGGQQPIEIATTPSRDEVQADLEHGADAIDDVQGERRTETALQSRQGRAMNPCAPGDVLL